MEGYNALVFVHLIDAFFPSHKLNVKMRNIFIICSTYIFSPASIESKSNVTADTGKHEKGGVMKRSEPSTSLCHSYLLPKGKRRTAQSPYRKPVSFQ